MEVVLRKHPPVPAGPRPAAESHARAPTRAAEGAHVHRRPAAPRRLLAIALLLLAGAGGCWAQSYTSAGSGNWDTTTTWSPNGVPGSGDTVSIGAHTITLVQAQAIDGITFTAAGTITGAFALTLGGGATISAASGITGTIASPIGGSAGLTKTGAGTLILTAANPYTGTTTIDGTLQLDSSTGTINQSAAIVINNAALLLVPLVTGASPAITPFNASATLTMNSGTFEFWGATVGARSVTLGTLILNAGLNKVFPRTGFGGVLTITFANGVTRNSNALLLMEIKDAAYVDRIVLGSGGSALASGIYPWMFKCNSAQDAYYPTTYSSATGLITSGNAQFTTANSGNWDSTGAGGTWSPTGTTPGIGNALKFGGAHAVDLNGANRAISEIWAWVNATSGVSITGAAGTKLTVANNIAVYSASQSPWLTISCPTLEFAQSAGGVANEAAIVTDSGNVSTISSTITGTDFTYASRRTNGLTLSGTNNAWTGKTTVATGRLTVSGGTAIPDGSAVVLHNTTSTNGTATQLTVSTAETVGSIAGGGANGGNLVLSAALTCGGDNSSTAYDGVISGAGALTKNGSGTLTLTRASSYTGLTTLFAGGLEVDAANGSSNLSLTGTGTLRGTGGVGTITTTAASSTTVVQPGTATSKGTLAGKATTLASGTTPTLAIRIAAYATPGTDYDRLNLASAPASITLGGSSKLLVDLAGVAQAGTAVGVVTTNATPTGTFASTATQNAPAGASITPQYTTTGVNVIVDLSDTTTWTNGAATGLWSNAGNWTNGVPSLTRKACFNSASTANCSIDTAEPHVLGIQVTSAYTGTITQAAANPVYLGTAGFVMSAGGTYTCNDTLYTPSFTQTAGTFGGTGTLYLLSKANGALSAASALNNLTIEGLDSGLVGYWKLDSASTTSEPDYSGLGHTASMVNAPASTATKATLSIDNRAARTCNTPGLKYLTAAGSTDFSPAGAFSVATWCHVADTGSQNYLMRYGDISTNGWLLAIGTSPNFVSRFAVYGGAGNTTSSGPTLTMSPATWYHLAGVYDGANTYIYVNGVPYGKTARTTAMTAPAAGSNSLYLGGDGGTNTCLGEVDDMRVYNRALSEAEIRSLYGGNHGDASYAATFTLGSAVTVNGNLTLWSGTLADGGNTLTVKGSLTLHGQLSGTGTVALTGTSAGQTIRSGAARFNNLTVNSAGGGAWTLQDQLNVAGTLSIGGGTLDTGSFTVRCGTFNQTGASGTLVPGTSTVVIDSPTGGSVRAATTLPALRVEDPSESGLVGYWKFDCQGGLTERDWSGNGNTATFIGGAMHSTAFPATTLFDNRGCATFDGSNDYLDAGSGASLDLTGAVTVCAWIKLGATGLDQKVLTRQTWTGGGYKLGVFTSDQVEFEVRDSSNNPVGNRGVTNGTTLSAGVWYHVAGVYSQAGGYLMCYVNGVPERRLADGVIMGSSPGPCRIGVDYDLYHNFSGQIDDVRIYSRALSPAEIRNLAYGRYVSGTSLTATTTLAANLAVTSLGIDAGTFNASGLTTTVTNLFSLADGQGAYTAGSGTQTFNGGLAISGSTFTGSTGTVAVNGDFTQTAVVDSTSCPPQSGGTFIAPSTTMTITGSVVHGGTFTPNGGTVQLTSGVAGRTLSGPIRSGLIGSYFASDLRGVDENDWRVTRTVAGTRIDPMINFTANAFGTAKEQIAFGITDLGAGNGWDGFSVQWDGWIQVATDWTSLLTISDDYSRVWIDFDGDNVVDAGEWGNNGWFNNPPNGQGPTLRTVHYNIPRGLYRIRVQYEEGNSGNSIQLQWTDSANSGGAAGSYYLVPSTMLAPVASGSPGLTFANLQTTVAGGWTVNDPLSASGTISCLAGTLTQAAGSAISAGAWSTAGGAFTGSGGTSSADKVTVAGALGCSSSAFTSPAYRVTVGGTLTVNGGTFVCPSNKLVVGGDLTYSSGTFTHNSGTVIMKSAVGRTLTCSQAFNHLVFSDGLVGRWQFDENASPSLDTSGWGHSATWYNGPSQDAAVKPTLFQDNAGALTTDGSDDYLEIADNADFRPTSTMTLAGWVWIPLASFTDEGGIIGRGYNNVRGWSLYTEDTTNPAFPQQAVMFRMNDNWGSGDNVVARNIPASSWHHVAFTFDGTNLTSYLDGVFAENTAIGAGTTPVSPTNAALWFGRYPAYGLGYTPRFAGKIDDFRWYDRNLSAGDIARLASGREPASSVATFTLGSNLTVAGDLTLGSGTLDLNTRAVSVAGNWRCGGVVNGGSSTVTFSGPGATGNTILCGNQSLANVVVAGTATWSCRDAFRASGTFTQSAATFSGNARPLTIGGDVAFNGGTFQSTSDVLRCGGGLTDAGGGLFVANPGVVRLTTASAKNVNLADSLNHLWIASGGDTGLVARFRLDEAHGANAIDDVSGIIAWYGNTPTATPSSTTAAPLVAANPYCLDFTGAQSGSDVDYVQLPSTPALDALQDTSYSLAAWFKARSMPVGTGPTNTTNYAIIIKPGNHEGLDFSSSGRFEIQHWLAGPTGAGVASAGTYGINAWHHVCGTVDSVAGTTVLYVDGVEAGRASFTPGAPFPFSSAPWRIGNANPTGGVDTYMWPADGWIDDVRLYSRVLSAPEVAALATGGIEGGPGTATISLTGPLDVNGDLALVSGTLSAGANQINAAAAWRNFAGASGFSGGSAAVVLDGGDQAIYGSTTFNAFTKTLSGAPPRTLTFPANECQTFTGTLTLQGADATNVLNIRSSAGGSQAAIRPVGATRTCSFLNVRDSRNYVLPLLAPRATTNCVDGGNTRWWFGGTLGGNGVLVGAPGID